MARDFSPKVVDIRLSGFNPRLYARGVRQLKKWHEECAMKRKAKSLSEKRKAAGGAK